MGVGHRRYRRPVTAANAFEETQAHQDATAEAARSAHRTVLAKAEEIVRTGRNPDAVPIEDVRALIRERLR